MLPYRLVYHEGYDLRLGDHVFPSQKFRYIHDRLMRDRFATAEDFLRPEPATDADILAVHEPGWVKRLQTGTLSYQEIMQLEVPYSRELVEAFWLAAGGTMLAARLALEQGIGFNVGGGFHHAFAGHGEGFCAINDIAVAIRSLQRGGGDRSIQRAMVVDYDVAGAGGAIVALNLDGSVAWTLPTARDESGIGVLSAPAVSQGMIFVGYTEAGCTTGPCNGISALDANTGQVLWRYKTTHSIYAGPAIVDGGLFVGEFDGTSVYCFTPNGV